MTTTTEPPPATPLADTTNWIRRTMERAHNIQQARIASWMPRLALAPVAQCPRHPGVALSPCVASSAQASAKADRVIIVCEPCQSCLADDARLKSERRLLLRGIPARSLGVTLETWQPDWEPTHSDQRGAAWSAVAEWTKARPNPFLIILGADCGSGKTALGVAALRSFGSGIRCLDYREWIDGLLALDMADRQRALESVRGYDALMLDDVGSRNTGARGQDGGNNVERDALATVLNYRFERRLPSIMTSNLTPANFIRRFDARTIDRIKAGRTLVDASGWPSRRAVGDI